MIAIFVCLSGCYRSQEIVEQPDTDTPSIPGQLEWAVPIGDNWAVWRPRLVDVSPEGGVTLLASVTALHNVDSSDTSSQPLGLNLVEYSADGVFLGRQEIGHGAIYVREIATLGETILVVGDLGYDPATFGIEGGNTVTLEPNASSNAFLASFSLDGELKWVRMVSGDVYSFFHDVAFTNDGDIITVGAFGAHPNLEGEELPPAVFEGPDGQVEIHSSGMSDALVARYSKDGELVWAKKAGGAKFDGAYSLAVSGEGHFFIGGNFGYDQYNDDNGSAVFGEGENATELFSSGGSDAFIARYSWNGELDWVFRVEYPGKSSYPRVRLTPEGSLRVTGSAGEIQHVVFHGTNGVDTQIETGGGYLAGVSPDGVVDWLRSPAGIYNTLVDDFEIFEDGSIAVGGTFTGEPVWGPGESAQTETPFDQETCINCGFAYSLSAYVARYNPDGTLIWVSFGKVEAMAASVMGIVVDPEGYLFTTGNWSIPCDDYGFCWGEDDVIFGLDEPNETMLVGSFQYQGFLTKYVL